MVNAGILSCHLDLRRFSSLLLGGNTREIRPSCRREVERVGREVERVLKVTIHGISVIRSCW